MTPTTKKTLIALAVIGGLVGAPIAYAAGRAQMAPGWMGPGQIGPGQMGPGWMRGGFMHQGPMGRGAMMGGFPPMMDQNMGDLGDMPKMTDAQLAYMGKILARLSPEQRAFAKQRMHEHGIDLPDANTAPATK